MGEQTIEIEFAGIKRSKKIKIKKPEIQDGFWSDPLKGTTTEATYGEKVKFTMGTKDIPDGTELNLTLYDYDGSFNLDDELSRGFKTTVKSNMAEIEFVPDIKWEEKAKYETDKVVEVYFKIEAEIESKKLTATNVNKKLSIELPKKEEEYLRIYGKPEVITVVIKVPPKKVSGYLNSKGLAGHSGIIVGNDYYDFGPDGSALYSDGAPWWDEGTKYGDLDRSKLLTILRDDTIREEYHIIGEVFLLDIEVSSKERIKLKKWWDNKYKNLGNYSIVPVLGEQCTSNVRLSLEQSTTALNKTNLADIMTDDLYNKVQTPESFLELLTTLGTHTYGKNKGKKIEVTKTYKEL